MSGEMMEREMQQLEAENAELREKLECAARQNALNMQAFAECVEQRRAAMLRHQRIVRGLYRILNDAEELSEGQVP
ncbi:MAG: hypothetical protein ACK46M_02890 [Planctomyces sp.]|jgi:hypothetical protein